MNAAVFSGESTRLSPMAVSQPADSDSPAEPVAGFLGGAVEHDERCRCVVLGAAGQVAAVAGDGGLCGAGWDRGVGDAGRR